MLGHVEKDPFLFLHLAVCSFLVMADQPLFCRRGWITISTLLLKGTSLKKGPWKEDQDVRNNSSLRGACVWGPFCLDYGGLYVCVHFLWYTSRLVSAAVVHMMICRVRILNQNDNGWVRRAGVVEKREREKSCISANPLSGDMWNGSDGESVDMGDDRNESSSSMCMKEHIRLLSRHPLADVGVTFLSWAW